MISLNLHNLIEEWDFYKNKDYDASCLKTSIKYWWVCKKNTKHKWQSSLSNRILQNRGCPYCCGQKVLKEESLAEKCPKLLEEWDFNKNSVDPYNITIGSHRKVWWKCKNNHSWCAIINTRAVRNVGCPFCVGKLATPENNLYVRFPNLMEEWDFSNDPKKFLPGSNKKVKWICKKNPKHVWICSINNRTANKSECPYCSGNKVLEEDSFGAKFPNLLKEWDFDKNLINPYKIAGQSGKYAWWVCSNNHKWYAQIGHRAKGSGCPNCSKRISKPATNWLDFLNILEREQTIIINNKRFIVDGSDLENKIIYEFYGDFWHGNPKKYNPNDINPIVKKTFGELYTKTVDRENQLIKHGFKIIKIWESEWNDNSNNSKQRLVKD